MTAYNNVFPHCRRFLLAACSAAARSRMSVASGSVGLPSAGTSLKSPPSHSNVRLILAGSLTHPTRLIFLILP